MLDEMTVLLPIDVQTGFDDPRWGGRNNPGMEANGLALLDAWRGRGWPVIHVRHDSITPGSVLSPEHPGNRHKHGFEPLPGEQLVTKSVNSAFIGTDLELRLRRLGATSLAVFGITTDQCVSTTVRMASNLGYKVLLIDDACACFDLPALNGGTIPAADIHRAHVATLAFEFAEVARTSDVVARLAAPQAA